MAEEEKIAVNHSHRGANIAAGAALVFSILALIVAGFGGRRGAEVGPAGGSVGPRGIDREETSGDQLRMDIREDIRLSIARAEVRARLLVIRAQLAAGRTGDEVVSQVRDARADLKDAYGEAKGETLEEYRALDDNLAKLEGQIRTNTSDALKTIEDLVRSLRRDIATDNESGSQ